MGASASACAPSRSRICVNARECVTGRVRAYMCACTRPCLRACMLASPRVCLPAQLCACCASTPARLNTCVAGRLRARPGRGCALCGWGQNIKQTASGGKYSTAGWTANVGPHCLKWTGGIPLGNASQYNWRHLSAAIAWVGRGGRLILRVRLKLPRAGAGRNP